MTSLHICIKYEVKVTQTNSYENMKIATKHFFIMTIYVFIQNHPLRGRINGTQLSIFIQYTVRVSYFIRILNPRPLLDLNTRDESTWTVLLMRGRTLLPSPAGSRRGAWRGRRCLWRSFIPNHTARSRQAGRQHEHHLRRTHREPSGLLGHSRRCPSHGHHTRISPGG